MERLTIIVCYLALQTNFQRKQRSSLYALIQCCGVGYTNMYINNNNNIISIKKKKQICRQSISRYFIYVYNRI